MTRTICLSGSVRADSRNAMLTRLVADLLVERGHDASYLDLGEFPMPVYNGDDEARDGPPEAAHRLGEQLAAADGLVVATPEYNGAMTPLLKNTVDWVTRADRSFLSGQYVGLMATSPGGRGGAHGLDLVRRWFSYLRLTVADEQLSIPRYGEALIIDEAAESATATAATKADIDAFVSAYLSGLERHVADKAAADTAS